MATSGLTFGGGGAGPALLVCGRSFGFSAARSQGLSSLAGGALAGNFDSVADFGGALTLSSQLVGTNGAVHLGRTGGVGLAGGLLACKGVPTEAFGPADAGGPVGAGNGGGPGKGLPEETSAAPEEEAPGERRGLLGRAAG